MLKLNDAITCNHYNETTEKANQPDNFHFGTAEDFNPIGWRSKSA